MTDLSKTVTIEASNVCGIKPSRVGNMVEVTLRMTLKELEKNIWPNEEVRARLPYCEFQKCATKGCDGRYAIIASKDEFGHECFECSSCYCDKHYEENMVKVSGWKWNCKKH